MINRLFLKRLGFTNKISFLKKLGFTKKYRHEMALAWLEFDLRRIEINYKIFL